MQGNALWLIGLPANLAQSDHSTTIAPPFGFNILVIAVLWVVVLQALGRLNGWRQLATRYPATHHVSGQSFAWQSLSLHPWGHYNHCINLMVSSGGVRLELWLLFRSGHPP